MVNKVLLVGRIAEPKSRQAGEYTVCSFGLATSSKYKKRDGTLEETTEWHNVEIWGKQAEFILNNAQKGSVIYVEGAIKTNSYKDKDGNEKSNKNISAERVQIISGWKKDNAEVAHNPEPINNSLSEPDAPVENVSDDDLPF